MAVLTTVWEKRYIKERDDIEQKLKFDRFARKAYLTYRSWISSNQKRILEVGFGTGRFCFALARDFPNSEIIGVDISNQLVDDANKAVRHLDIKNLAFQVGDCFNLDFPDGQFDIVFNEGVIEHFQDHEAAFKEMVRVTKPGGMIIAGVPNLYCFPHTIRKFFIRLFCLKYEYGFEKSFTPKQLKTLFNKYHLESIDFCGYYFMQSIIRLTWCVKGLAVLAKRINLVRKGFYFFTVLCRFVEDKVIAMVDAKSNNLFSNLFGFEIVARGVKPDSNNADKTFN